ncbi:acyl-CoA dehydrogenase family protein [Micromonospora sp. RP3T]|uniref:acyl-CoA dehydrogenase family protein n=1 Tax=Micromonospora sp. RP3T TaxID=2135446 RepID=UPI003D74438F
MEFRIDAAQRNFRDEVCRLLRSERSAKIIGSTGRFADGGDALAWELYQDLGERGWLAANWPEHLGGVDRTVLDAAAVTEELHWHGVHDTLHVVTVDFVGYFLLLAGTPEQRERHLPAMASGRSFACTLHSEPEAGSDLAALRTTAVPQPDGGFLLTGTKLWSLWTDRCDVALCSARVPTPGAEPTGADGITLFLVSMSAPGVVVDPVATTADEQFAEVRLRDVRVDAADVVGQVGHGWALLTSVLAIERTGLEQSAKIRHWLDVVVAHARATGALADPAVADTVAALDAEVEAARLMSWRCLSDLHHGALDPAYSAMAKYVASELAERIADLAADLAGADVAVPRSAGATDGGFAEWIRREAPGVSISAGTSEMMLQIVAASRGTGAVA